jgi:phosphoenolpyruvate carboxykinase (ATP)
VPISVPGIDGKILDPRETWTDKAEYEATARRLVGLFRKNFERFETHVDQAVRAAGPVGEQAAVHSTNAVPA